MIQDITKITIEFVNPVDNSDGVIKITTNEYGQELTNETKVQAVIWEAYKDTLINNIQYPVEGFENPIKIASTLDDLIEQKASQIKELAKQSNYDLGIKLGTLLISKNNDMAFHLSINLETLLTTYKELINLEKEIRVWVNKPHISFDSFLVDLSIAYPTYKWHIIHFIEPRQTVFDSTKEGITFVGIDDSNKDKDSKGKWYSNSIEELHKEVIENKDKFFNEHEIHWNKTILFSCYV